MSFRRSLKNKKLEVGGSDFRELYSQLLRHRFFILENGLTDFDREEISDIGSSRNKPDVACNLVMLGGQFDDEVVYDSVLSVRARLFKGGCRAERS